MTYKEWCDAFALLSSDVEKLLKKVHKLEKLKAKGKQKQFNLLFPEVCVNLAYSKKIFERLDEQKYWHKQHFNEDTWSRYKECTTKLFCYLETLISEWR